MWCALESFPGIHLASRLLEGSQQLQWCARCSDGDNWKLGHLPPHVLSGSPHVSLQQGHQTSYTVAQDCKTKSAKKLEAETCDCLRPGTRTSMMHSYRFLLEQSQASPGSRRGMSESLQPSLSLQAQTLKKLGTGQSEAWSTGGGGRLHPAGMTFHGHVNTKCAARMGEEEEQCQRYESSSFVAESQ